MHIPAMILVLALGVSPLAIAAESDTADKSEGSKGLSVEDLGRGLKSAVKNVEQEIPKIGPAIVDTVKKLGGKASAKPSTETPEKQK